MYTKGNHSHISKPSGFSIQCDYNLHLKYSNLIMIYTYLINQMDIDSGEQGEGHLEP